MPTKSQNASQYKNSPAGSVIAASTTIFALDVQDFNNVLLMVQGTYAAGLSLVWEVSLDGVHWTGVQAVRTDAGTAETSASSLTANQTRAWDIYIGCFNFFRVRSTTWAAPSGECVIWAVATELPIDPAIVATIAGNPAVVGSANHSAASSGGPVRIGGRVATSVETTLIAGDACDLQMSTAQQAIVKSFAGADNDWRFTASTTTTTTAAALKSAGAASVRNYVTALQLQNTSATATTFLLVDGSTTVWQCNLPANMNAPIVVDFPTPIRGTAAAAMNYNFGTAGATVLVNAQGFQSF